MGTALARVVAGDQRKSDRARRDGLNANERSALRSIRREAKQAGSWLTTGGEGGGSPSFCLGIFRRDKFTCKKCGQKGTKENGGLGLHHIGGIVSSARTSRLGHRWVPSNVVSLCHRCHDRAHQEAREEGIDSSQVTPEGDE